MSFTGLFDLTWISSKMSKNEKSPNPEQVFHALHIPTDDDSSPTEERLLHVYLDKVEALKVIKKYKNARLKTFKSRWEAEKFAQNGYKEQKVEIVAKENGEKSSDFKAPKSQDFVKFRRLIEKGDLNAVKTTIWDNPRYLVSDGDTPAILQEGCRYNALHVAVKVAGTAEMCELILSTVRSAEFIQLLYGNEEKKNYLDRSQILLDLYLNTPDKGLNETPLHFAVKFGLKDVVQLLVSYPECMKNLPNKHSQLPSDMICMRKHQDNQQLIREIQLLLDDQYYVPVWRSEDNTIQPTIGEPFSPQSPPYVKNEPLSPKVEIKAFAGPMSKDQAIEFRRKWKTPPRINSAAKDALNSSFGLNSSFNLNNSFGVSYSPVRVPVKDSFKNQDSEKGLERYGRELAEEYKVNWKEYWPFLKDFADFRSQSGLQKLETYLERKNLEYFPNERIKTETRYTLNTHEALNNTIDDLCGQLEASHIISDENDDSDCEFFTPPSSPFPFHPNQENEEMANAEEGRPVFIDGTSPSKTDLAVFNALPSNIDLTLYPNIYRWRHEMQLGVQRNSISLNCSTPVRRKLRI